MIFGFFTKMLETNLKNLKNGFHANKDCSEVREKVFKLLKKERQARAAYDSICFNEESGHVRQIIEKTNAENNCIEKYHECLRRIKCIKQENHT